MNNLLRILNQSIFETFIFGAIRNNAYRHLSYDLSNYRSNVDISYCSAV